MNRRDAAFGEIVELLAADAIDALVAAHPEVAGIVREDLKDPVAEQTIAHIVVCAASIFETVQAAVIGADPERPVVVLVKRADTVARQAIGLRVRRELTIRQMNQSPVGAEPEGPGAIFEDRVGFIVRQSVRGSVAFSLAFAVLD